MDLLVTKLCVPPGSLEPFSKTNPTTPSSGSAALTLDSPSMGISELLPALGRTGAFISLKMGFLWVFLGFSQGFLHIPRNFPTTTSRSKFPPVTPQINRDCLIGFYALLRGETLISQASPWKPRIPSRSKERINSFPWVGIESPWPPGTAGGRNPAGLSSPGECGREIEFPKQECRWFLSGVKAPGMGLVRLRCAQNATENPTGSVRGEPRGNFGLILHPE